jgi:NADH-quinone oxidoreductase subunit N
MTMTLYEYMDYYFLTSNFLYEFFGLDNVYFFELTEIVYLFPELFLGISLIFLLLHSSLIASSANKNFPLIANSLINLIILTLIGVFLLVDNSAFIIDSSFFNNTIVFDNLSLSVKKIVLILSVICFLIIKPYLRDQKINSFEYSLLVLFSIFGLILLSSSNDLITAFLCIEVQSLSFYLLAAYKRSSIFSTEAGLKYFILGAFSSSMFLFGSSIIYGCSGALNFEDLKDLYFSIPAETYVVAEYEALLMGLLFILVSLLFKLAVAPFHIWSPDIYENSLTSSTIFFAILPKLSLFVFLTRLFQYSFLGFLLNYKIVFVSVGLISILIGSFVGLEVRKVKTLLAYSSISHMGYTILAFSTGSIEGIQSVFSYLIIYLFSSLCLWSIFVITRLKKNNFKKMNKDLSDFALLGKSNKILAITFSIALLSLAGFPPLIGFYAKMNVFLSLIQATQYFSAAVAILCSVISTFYYIRIIKIIYFENLLVGNLYYPMDYINCLILSVCFFGFLILFLNPTLLYLYTYKLSLLNLIY